RTVVEFDFEARQERSIPLGAVASACADGKYCWIDLDLNADGDRGEAEALLRGLGVAGPTVEHALGARDDGRHDFFDDVVHVTVTAAELSDGALVTSPVDF